MKEIREIGSRAKAASKILRTACPDDKTRALEAIAAALREHKDEIIRANQKDIETARENAMAASMVDRLMLNSERIEGMAAGVQAVANWPDPVGRTIEEYQQPNGLNIRRVSVPLGVIGIIFEARPNVASDCACLCIRAGNTVILRGGSEAINSNKATVEIMRNALKGGPIPEDAIQLITDTSHESATALMEAVDYVDVLIPRGGKGLIQRVIDKAKVPVIQTGAGNVHIYVDKDASLNMACSIVENAKTQRPSVCNAAEKLLIHSEIADEFLPLITQKLQAKNVELKGDMRACSASPAVAAASADDWGREYVDLIMSIKIVDSVDEAIDHIERYSTHHSDCIVTENPETAAKFQAEIDSAAVYWNASTRFTDGGELGLGAEIGISTQKLHARGPMGVDQLTSYKYVINGDGQIRN